jgi:hypothetical protein
MISGAEVYLESTMVLRASLKSLMNSNLRGLKILRHRRKPLITMTLLLEPGCLMGLISSRESLACCSCLAVEEKLEVFKVFPPVPAPPARVVLEAAALSLRK